MWGWWSLNREIETLAKLLIVRDCADDRLGEMSAGSGIFEVEKVVVIGEEIAARGFGGDEGGGDFIVVDAQFYQLSYGRFEQPLSGVFPGAADADD